MALPDQTNHLFPTVLAAELPDYLLASCDNYQGAADAPGLARDFAMLRREKFLDACTRPEHNYRAHGSRDGAAQALARQLRLLYDAGRASLPLGRIFEGHVNALELIDRFGSEAQRQQALSDAENGLVFAVWNTETSDGVKVDQLEKDCYELLGAKTFCSGVGQVMRPIITGELWQDGRAQGWQMIIVPMEGVPVERIDGSFWQPLGMQASDSYRVDFSQLQLDKEALLGQVDDYHIQPHFSGGAIRFAAVQLGGARALFDQSLALLKSMHRENDPYQVHRIAQMELAHQSAFQWLAGASQHALPGWNSEYDIIHYANMMRTAILQACNVILANCEEAVGARGFLQPKQIQRIYTDLKMYLRQPAPDAAMAAIGRHAAETFQMPSSLPC